MRNAFLSTVPGRPPLCTPKTSARPPPTCPASPRQRPSCSPSQESGDVGVPVGTRGLPRLGGGDLLPGGSRWSAKVVRHEKSSKSCGFMADLWEKSKGQRGPHFLDFNEKILFHTPVKNCGNSPQSAVDDHQNHSQNIISSVRGERRPSDLLGPCLWWLTVG